MSEIWNPHTLPQKSRNIYIDRSKFALMDTYSLSPTHRWRPTTDSAAEERKDAPKERESVDCSPPHKRPALRMQAARQWLPRRVVLCALLVPRKREHKAAATQTNHVQADRQLHWRRMQPGGWSFVEWSFTGSDSNNNHHHHRGDEEDNVHWCGNWSMNNHLQETGHCGQLLLSHWYSTHGVVLLTCWHYGNKT